MIASPVEPRFTQTYSQPESYRFCQDSVLAPLHIARDLEGWFDGASMRALDLGAGCGVMGIELSHAVSTLANMDFLEIQEEFEPHFLANRGSRNRFRFVRCHWSALGEAPLARSYDLVISNPPYFASDEGSLGPDELSNRCRFFLDDSFDGMVRAARSALKPDGRAYLLVKSGDRHGRNAITLLRTIVWDCDVAIIADIRGTALIRIQA